MIQPLGYIPSRCWRTPPVHRRFLCPASSCLSPILPTNVKRSCGRWGGRAELGETPLGTTCACGQGAVAAVQHTVMSAGAVGLKARHVGTGSPCQAHGIVTTQGPGIFSPEVRVIESHVSVSGPCSSSGSCSCDCW